MVLVQQVAKSLLKDYSNQFKVSKLLLSQRESKVITLKTIGQKHTIRRYSDS